MIHSHVVVLKDIYNRFQRYLQLEDRYHNFLLSDYDEIAKPLLDYIAKYGYTPGYDYYMGNVHCESDTIPDNLLRSVVRTSGLKEVDIVYFVSMIADKTNHIVENMFDSYTQASWRTLGVNVINVGKGEWMFKITY